MNKLVLRSSTFAEDANGNEVFLAAGDSIAEIEDAGPDERTGSTLVSLKFTPKHKLWTEIVTIDAVKLLKALDG